MQTVERTAVDPRHMPGKARREKKKLADLVLAQAPERRSLTLRTAVRSEPAA